MIKLSEDAENWIFEIDGDNLYDYIHLFFEEHFVNVLINELINNHDLITAQEACKLLLSKHRYYDIILDGLEKIITKQGSIVKSINKKKVAYEEDPLFCLLDNLHTKYKYN